MNFKPLQDYIVVRPIERKQSAILAVVSYEKQCRGEILAVGPGKPDKRGNVRPLASKPGEIIAFGNGDFDFYPRVEHNGEECRLIQEADICFVFDEPEALAA